MTDTDTQTELEALRREVAALSAARRAKREPGRAQATPETETEPKPSEPPAESAASEDRVASQVEELVGLLESELRDNPMVTGAAIFVAGLFVGRMLR